MPIDIGAEIPETTLHQLGAEGMETINTKEFFANKRAVLFGVPGAFTPACSQKHLPGFVQAYNTIMSRDIDAIACLSVNDPFVMDQWAKSTGAFGRIEMLPDGNGDFIKALDLDTDGSNFGLGLRSRRFLMIIDNGKVEQLVIEDDIGQVKKTSADACIELLTEQPAVEIEEPDDE